eukprot:CAMPEP_0203828176 /NCGR_PEP_ID=MMETSP0115-20131106/60638_1 /ASSEMBLY_ACC=CAM_ASM_000227 /TAXON_ID=33651 /ORGANISM="Bicosoecid sp, Strain ms1" /LENGTH=134 /DNA_ID=CAMNT_0050737233 /DNA_START=149 /DNA_END=550 /DNA_ORIENTATION=-
MAAMAEDDITPLAMPARNPGLARLQTSAGLVFPADSPVLRGQRSKLHMADRAIADTDHFDDEFDLDVALGVKGSDGRVLESPESSLEGTPHGTDAYYMHPSALGAGSTYGVRRSAAQGARPHPPALPPPTLADS